MIIVFWVVICSTELIFEQVINLISCYVVERNVFLLLNLCDVRVFIGKFGLFFMQICTLALCLRTEIAGSFQRVHTLNVGSKRSNLLPLSICSEASLILKVDSLRLFVDLLVSIIASFIYHSRDTLLE